MLENYCSYIIRQPVISAPVFLNLLPILLIWRKRAYNDKMFFILFVYLILKFGVDLVMFDLASQRKNSVLYYNLNIPVRYVLTSWMFYYKLDYNAQRKWLMLSWILFVAFSAWDIIHTNPSMGDLYNHKMVLYSTTLESLLMLFWIMLYFYNTMRALKIPNLLTYPFFWICSGFLLYYSSLLFIAPVLHYASKWDQWMDIGSLDYIPYAFETVSLLLFSIGIAQYTGSSYAK
ncbi:hypothetical protein SAMN04487996_104232 [Dyadobacter soli]|uniref:Uncharacterized protein n=1 Tax=Dyadobacter soli TaxID=659014 RepID=A0A1G7BM54_9BACT|nr:hypothetical protein SAMN04487996_104232 [Dyadobacter soli]